MKHDDSIDFIKGIAILLVITFHSIIGFTNKIAGVLSIEQGVPLFLMVSSYLYFKANNSKPAIFYKKEHFLKLLNRIFIPFFLFQIPILFISYLRGGIGIFNIVASGGIGMGSYYPWLYFQFWLLLPFFLYLIQQKKINIWFAIGFSIIIEIIFNLLVSINILSNYSDLLWRLFVGRYVFIIYIGYLISENKYNVKKIAPITIIGLIITLLQRYSVVDFPFIYYTPGSLVWKGFHWQLYFYSGSLFVLLKFAFVQFPNRIKNTIKWLGHHSWELFLSQMLYFHIFRLEHFQIINPYISVVTFIIFSIMASIIITLIYLKIRNTTNNRIQKLN